MRRQSLTAHTQYAELLEQTLALETSRSLASVRGSFITRQVKGQTYHYYHYRDLAGAVRQLYLGPESAALRRFIDKAKTGKQDAKADLQRIEELCAALAATGANITPSGPAKVIQALADAGLFRHGMVLVGTHAFAVLGNVLGVRWGETATTQDIDFVYHSDIDVVMPGTQTIPIADVLDELKMGFLPIPKLNPKHPSTSFRVRGKELRVDFLVPVEGRLPSKPVFLPQLNTAAEPLRFLDYLIESTQQAVVVANRGILVNVPSPGRYALHKLIVATERHAAAAAKARKDIDQAAQLVAVLMEDNPGELRVAWRSLAKRGEGWVRRAVSGLRQMAPRYPEIAERLKAATSVRNR
jgi:hypothetical protein